jgi:hypothetical protein
MLSDPQTFRFLQLDCPQHVRVVKDRNPWRIDAMDLNEETAQRFIQ